MEYVYIDKQKSFKSCKNFQKRRTAKNTSAIFEKLRGSIWGWWGRDAAWHAHVVSEFPGF